MIVFLLPFIEPPVVFAAATLTVEPFDAAVVGVLTGALGAAALTTGVGFGRETALGISTFGASTFGKTFGAGGVTFEVSAFGTAGATFGATLGAATTGLGVASTLGVAFSKGAGAAAFGAAESRGATGAFGVSLGAEEIVTLAPPPILLRMRPPTPRAPGRMAPKVRPKKVCAAMLATESSGTATMRAAAAAREAAAPPNRAVGGVLRAVDARGRSEGARSMALAARGSTLSL